MRTTIILIIIGSLILSNFIGFADPTVENEIPSEITIHQIAPTISPSLTVSYQQSPSKQKEIEQHLSHQLNENAPIHLLLLTTEELYESIIASSFITWKTSIGYTITIKNVTDEEIHMQPGNDLPQKIRGFLRESYEILGITHLLLIGDVISIPMRYCYPDPTNHDFEIFNYLSGEVPTDYYYADLSASDEASWDSDQDGYFGEYGQDHPDFQVEIAVGRIPTSNPGKITYTLDKIAGFEQSSSEWKDHALHAGAFFYFDNEDRTGYNTMDGAVLSHYIEHDIMTGWTVHKYSEQDGLQPSQFEWDPLTEANFINDWRTGSYSIVNWQGHGWTNRVARKVWVTDDGDGIPEGSEISWPNMITRFSNLDDDHPSILTAVSCYVGCPEQDPYSSGNLGIDLLTDPDFGAAVAVVASARSPYGSDDWPTSPGGSDQIIYEFNNNVITNKMTIGDALYQSKYFCTTTYGWDSYLEYLDLYTFNLFGDPTMVLESIIENHAPETPIIHDGTSQIRKGIEYDYTISSNDPDNDPVYFLIEWGDGITGLIYGPYESGEQCTISYTWFEQGDYEIRVKAIDEQGAESDWSEPYLVSLSKQKHKDLWYQIIPWLHQFLKHWLPTIL